MMSDVPGTAAGVFVGMATVAALICIYFSIAPQRVEPKEAQRVLAALLCPHILIAVSLIVAVLLVFQRTADQTKIDELAGLSETNQTAAKKEFLDNNLAMFAIMLGQKLDQRCDDNGVINGNGLVKCGTKSDIRFWKDNSYLHVGNLRSDQSVREWLRFRPSITYRPDLSAVDYLPGVDWEHIFTVFGADGDIFAISSLKPVPDTK